MVARLPIDVDRARNAPLAAQIHQAIREAIEDGRIAPGARLPSWRDLAAQLGVARGTVQAAYQRLVDEQLAIGLGAAGTRVREWAVRLVPGRALPFAGLGEQRLIGQHGAAEFVDHGRSVPPASVRALRLPRRQP